MRKFSSRKSVARYDGVWREVFPGGEGHIGKSQLVGVDMVPGLSSSGQGLVPLWLGRGYNHQVTDEIAAQLERDGFPCGGPVEPPAPPRQRTHAAPPRDARVDELDAANARIDVLEAKIEELLAEVKGAKV